MKKLLFIFVIVLSFGTTAQNWYPVSVPTTSKLLAIDFPSSSVGYIVGEDTTILKTTDGGQTWSQLSTNGIQTQSLAYAITDVHFVDELIGFIVVGYSGTYKTIDGGQSWALVAGQTSNMCFPQTIYPFSENSYFIGGAGCFEGAIIDEFASGTWTRNTPAGLFWDSQENVQEIDFVNSNLGLAAVKNQYLLRTTDGGQSWDTVPTGIDPNGFLTSVLMVNDTLCYAGYANVNTSGFGVLMSVDGGLTWAEDVNSATFFYPDYFCLTSANNGTIYSGGQPSFGAGGLIFETTLGATTIWDYATVDQPIYDMDSYGNAITFGVGDSGYVVVNTPTIDLAVQQLDVIPTISMYPNPANVELIVESSATILSVKVVNLAGMETKVRQQALTNKAILNVSELSSGLYSVLITTENGNTTKRFCVE